MYQKLIATTPAEHKLYSLQAEWRLLNEHGQACIEAQIEEHPEWGIEVGLNGPQFRASSNSLPESNLSRVKRLEGC
jgi:hypothetical protein